MLWVPPFSSDAAHRPVDVAVVGAGTFGRGVVAQGIRAPGLRVCAVADRDLDAAQRVFAAAGVPAANVVVCESAEAARTALLDGRRVVTEDAGILFDQDVDVVVEATGSPEAGARHAREAIAYGKHVAMVTKEADAAVGPILRHLADRAGVAYLPVDGDQHGLLIGLVAWARSIGLDVVCGGKALDGELVVGLPPEPDPTVRHPGGTLPIPHNAVACFAPTSGADDLTATVARRAEVLGPVGGAKPWDLTELTIAANATGLVPDRPALHGPALWTTEIPAALRPDDVGGLLAGPGRVEAVQVLRQPHEAGLAGGVFLVVGTPNGVSKHLFPAEAAGSDPAGRTALVTHPQHLLGIEAISTILAAALMGAHAGAALDYRPRFDIVYRATRALRAGTRVGDDHSPDLSAEIVASTPLRPDAPLPAGLAAGNPLRCDVPAGALVTADAVVPPADSALWSLRSEQDAYFHTATGTSGPTPHR